MIKCEHCKINHDKMYGSGRFCSQSCAKKFSTSLKRKEINEKVSLKLSGKPLSKAHRKYISDSVKQYSMVRWWK